MPTGPSSPIVITGLTNGVTYRARVRARNESGWGAWSPYSSPFTPTAQGGGGGEWAAIFYDDFERTVHTNASFLADKPGGGDWSQCHANSTYEGTAEDRNEIVQDASGKRYVIMRHAYPADQNITDGAARVQLNSSGLMQMGQTYWMGVWVRFPLGGVAASPNGFILPASWFVGPMQIFGGPYWQSPPFAYSMTTDGRLRIDIHDQMGGNLTHPWTDTVPIVDGEWHYLKLRYTTGTIQSGTPNPALSPNDPAMNVVMNQGSWSFWLDGALKVDNYSSYTFPAWTANEQDTLEMILAQYRNDTGFENVGVSAMHVGWAGLHATEADCDNALLDNAPTAPATSVFNGSKFSSPPAIAPYAAVVSTGSYSTTDPNVHGVVNVADPTGIARTVLKLTTNEAQASGGSVRIQAESPESIVDVGDTVWHYDEVYLPAGFPLLSSWQTLFSMYGDGLSGSGVLSLAMNEMSGANYITWVDVITTFTPIWRVPATTGVWHRVAFKSFIDAAGWHEIYYAQGHDTPLALQTFNAPEPNNYDGLTRRVNFDNRMGRTTTGPGYDMRINHYHDDAQANFVAAGITSVYHANHKVFDGAAALPEIDPYFTGVLE